MGAERERRPASATTSVASAPAFVCTSNRLLAAGPLARSAASAVVGRGSGGAFVAPFWEVEDERALQFAQVFYESLLAGQTSGEAIRAARLAVKRTGNPTWLAYCLYGHPAATLAGPH